MNQIAVCRHSDFIAINKPHGVAVHGEDLLAAVARQNGIERLWLVHRLDKVTSGLLLLAKNAEAAAVLSALFERRQVAKTYWALAQGKPKKKQGWVIGDMAAARNGAYKLLRSKERPAVTRFHSTACGNGLRRYIVEPQTGRTHQIRVAMKSLGVPILGDTLYGAAAAERVYLHAHALSFVYQNQVIDISCLPPSDALWQQIEPNEPQ